MKIAIIGSGPSGLYTAIVLAKKHSDATIFVIDKNAKIGRKLYATGNGHCNLLNASLAASYYNHPDFMMPILAKYPFSFLNSTLKNWGIPTMAIGECLYPLSFSSVSYVDFLSSLCQSLSVHFVLNERVVDYSISKQKIQLKLEKGTPLPLFDFLVIAPGGVSTPNLGSDGSLFSVLRQHGYTIEPLRPGLAPIKVYSKDLSLLAGLRHEAEVKAETDDKVVFDEKGEILYKKDGLSGIVVFNAESVLFRLPHLVHPCLHVDLFPSLSLSEIIETLKRGQREHPSFYWKAYFSPALFEHIRQRARSEEPLLLAKAIKDLAYDVKEPYPFANSQVTIGGVSLKEIDSALSSKREKPVYFAGEVVDIDGLCGGYNLSWDLLSALLIGEKL